MGGAVNPSTEAFLFASVKDRMQQAFRGTDFEKLKGAILAAKMYAAMNPNEVRAAELKAEALRWGWNANFHGEHNFMEGMALTAEKLMEESELEQNRKLALEYLKEAAAESGPSDGAQVR